MKRAVGYRNLQLSFFSIIYLIVNQAVNAYLQKLPSLGEDEDREADKSILASGWEEGGGSS